MKLGTKILSGLIVLFGLFSPSIIFARETSAITDWYVADFNTTLKLNTDSTLDVTEKIVADCGNLPDKHGIFRTMPTRMTVDGKTYDTPIELKKITDFNGKEIPYSITKNSSDHTITWKIGDPNKTVTGKNNYRIEYKYKNVIIPTEKEDRFFWNVSGNSWIMDIDKFSASLLLPDNTNKEQVKFTHYDGFLGETTQDIATAYWANSKEIGLTAGRTIAQGEGITVDLKFPPKTFTPYVPTFWEKYSSYILIWPGILLAILAFLFWNKYGRDPKVKKSITPEYDPPANLSPIELGYLFKGYAVNSLYSAELIHLAVRKFIKIEEIPKQSLFKGKDYKLTLLSDNFTVLKEYDLLLIQQIFGPKGSIATMFKKPTDIQLSAGQEVMLSELKNKFQPMLINEATKKELIASNYLVKNSFTNQGIMFVVAFLVFFGGIFSAPNLPALGIPLIASAIISFILALLMTKQTKEGAEVTWQIKGFKLYMETAEKYRQQFFEKENIFETLLPYAIVFGLTKEWIKKMETIYGKEYFSTYHPIWYAGSVGAFDADSFVSAMDSVSASVASASSSGSGGAGGGGGGGGGGGW